MQMLYLKPVSYKKINTFQLLVKYIGSASDNTVQLKSHYKEQGTVFIEKLVDSTPNKCRPYLKLIRLDRPIGTWVIYLPSAWGIALGTPFGEMPSLYMLGLFGMGSILMRGAGCTINDILDKEYDKCVDRTKDRPLPRGDISVSQALVCLGGQMALALVILLQFNWYTIFLGLSSTGLMFTYPLFKRFTYWPQLVLGSTVNWGLLVGYCAVSGHINWSVCMPTFLASIFWTVIYDTAYGYQDIEDDKALGLKSTSIYFGSKCKQWMSGFAVGMGGLLALAGYNYGAGPIYYTGMALTMAHVGYQLYSLNIADQMQCLKLFKSNRNTGLMAFSSIVLDRFFYPGMPL